MRIRWVIGAVAILMSCTAKPSMRQVSGTDTYQMTSRARSGDGGVLIAQYSALEDARKFCAARGKRFSAVTNRVDREWLSGGVAYTVEFRCPPPGSPELQRPTVNEAPDDLL